MDDPFPSGPGLGRSTYYPLVEDVRNRNFRARLDVFGASKSRALSTTIRTLTDEALRLTQECDLIGSKLVKCCEEFGRKWPYSIKQVLDRIPAKVDPAVLAACDKYIMTCLNMPMEERPEIVAWLTENVNVSESKYQEIRILAKHRIPTLHAMVVYWGVMSDVYRLGILIAGLLYAGIFDEIGGEQKREVIIGKLVEILPDALEAGATLFAPGWEAIFKVAPVANAVFGDGESERILRADGVNLYIERYLELLREWKPRAEVVMAKLEKANSG